MAHMTEAQTSMVSFYAIMAQYESYI